MLTLLIVDDEYLVRLGIRQTIEWEKYGIEIIGEACDGEEALELAFKLNPDIIITDIRMTFMDGLEFMEKVREKGLKSSIIVLSGYDQFDYARTALENGAAAYILKPVENEKLVETVKKVARKLKEERISRLYYEKLKEELSSIKKQFLRDLLVGNIVDRSEVESKISFLDIPLYIENNFIIVVKIDNFDTLFKNFFTEEYRTIKEYITYNISQMLLLNSKYMGVLVDSGPGEWVVFLHVHQVTDGIEQIIISKCLEFTSGLKNEQNYTVSVGISRFCRDIKDIRNAYVEACSAAAQKLIPSENAVSFAGDNEISSVRREIRGAIEYIKKNYQNDITIESVAKELYISSYYLMHLFRTEMGKTFNECLIDYRIYLAKNLLKDPQYKIYEVGEKVGYKDAKYFSQIFRKVTGMSPSDYIRQVC